MEPLFPESCTNQAFMYDFYKDVIKRLMLERTLAQILEEAENVEELRLNPTKIQEEYEELVERTVALRRVLRALNVCSAVTRFVSSHPFTVGFGEVARILHEGKRYPWRLGRAPFVCIPSRLMLGVIQGCGI